jgi:serine/threonine protein kinase
MIVNELDLTGKNLSNYKVVGKLGKGGMATVYKAHELSLNRVVALKVLSQQLSEDTGYIKRFEREAQAAAQLNHPNIVQVYAIGEEQGVHYFAMEYIKGQSLAQIKQEEGILAPGKATPIIRQVADALAEAHKAGLVHRDIKPSNIMIDAAGRPKVTDFGIAYVSQANTKLTRDGSIIGTPEYLSPEQCEGKTVDQRSDIYSLGVTFYEILSGKTPYEADTPVSMLMKIVKGEFPPLNEVNPNVPKPLQTVVEKMMQKDVQKRYQDMGEVINDLQKAESELLGAAAKEPATMSYQEIEAQQSVPVPHQGNRWAAIIVAAVIVILMGGAFAAKMLYFDKKSADSPSTPAVEEKAAMTQEISPATPESQQTPVEPQETSETVMPTAEGQQQEQEAAVPQPESSTFEPMTSSDTAPASAAAGSTVTAAVPGSMGSRSSTNPTGSAGSTGFTGSSDSTGSTGSSGPTAVRPFTSRSTVKPLPATLPQPPARSCIITAVGDEDKADLVAPYVEEILSKRNFTVIDGPSVSGQKVADLARSRIVVTVTQTGSTTLEYYGKSSEMLTVRLTMKVVNPKTGKILAGPVNKTVEYTALNSQEKLKQAVVQLVSGVLPVLEAQSR